MQSISEIIQTIARQRARGEASPLLATLPLEGAPGERIAHLPIDSDLAQAWVALTREPFRPHQAHALAALRRGEPVALRASSADVAMTSHLLLYAALLADRAATALVLAPDMAAAQAVHARIERINQDLPRGLTITAALPAPGRRTDLYARVVIATPELVHGRMLRHHDRAWQRFWPQLQLIALPELQRHTGVAAAHLADLLMRVQRVAANHSGGHAPNLLATLLDVAEPEPTLTSLLGHPWRVVLADDDPRQPGTLSIWRGGGAWLRDATDLATALQRQGYQVHIHCRPIETTALAPIVGDLPRVTFGADLAPGQALIAAGFPGSHSVLRRMLRAGYQAVVLVLGELPHEQALARHAGTILAAPPSAWAPPAPNAYVLARNILCAASELPLTEADVAAWGVRDIVDRLVAQRQLVDLPDPEVAWKPAEAAGDPYADWSPQSAVGDAIVARTEQSQALGTIAPAVYERWAFPNAALPPGAGGFRVLARDDDAGVITLRPDTSGRRSYPLRRCEVTLRDTRAMRTLPGSRPVGWGRVVVSEEIYGYREASSGGAPADVALKPALTTRWPAPACWFDLQSAVQVNGQLIGWSLAAVLPLRALADMTDMAPCYDHELRRLYLVDAQPGGNGLAAWVYEHAEELLPLAYDVAHACRNDPLLEPLSRVDMDWLLTLLGPRVAEPIERERPHPAPARPEPARPAPQPPPAPARPEPTRPEPARRIEYVAGPPAEQPIFGDAATHASTPASQRPTPARPLDTLGNRGVEGTGDQRPTLSAATPAAPPDQRPPLPAASRPAGPNPRDERPTGGAPAAAPSPPASSERHPEPAGGPRRPSHNGGAGAPPGAEPRTGPAAPPDDAPPDPNALIERLRRQRQQREAAQLQPVPARRPAPRPAEQDVARRFAAGERIFCLPYGDGLVRDSRVEDGRELLTVAFPDYGELEIDPAVSLVRKLESAAPEEDDLL